MPTHDGRRCWGWFNNRKPVEIGIAAKRPAYYKGRLADRDRKIRSFLDTFAHEFVHYEKWRDKRPQNHRGLQQRVNALINRFENDFHQNTRAS